MTVAPGSVQNAEKSRLNEADEGSRDWRLWGTYLAERQWGTVREDYSVDGSVWESLSHHDAIRRAYRWGEDGLLGITDRECRLCFAMAFWNGRDPILKERLFGLTGPEGNHGEDVKECYFYLDATPTHSYMKALYKYPQAEFPYERLVAESRARGRDEPELELVDTGAFDDNRYFDIFLEYAKAGPTDLLIRVTIENRADHEAELHALPTLWYRNTWSWGREGDAYPSRPVIRPHSARSLLATHETLGSYLFQAVGPDEGPSRFLFTENETNARALYGLDGCSPYSKDAFHDYLVRGETCRVNPARQGTKAAELRKLRIGPRSSRVLRYRLAEHAEGTPREFSAEEFDRVFATRIAEADAFHAADQPQGLSEDELKVRRQARAGLIWSKQFYHYNVREWLEGDPAQPMPPASRREGRNRDWLHFDSKDILAMPDRWEYPWFAAWDLAFQAIPLARLDPTFAKDQLRLLLKEWFMSPRGEIPAYEFNFSDANPPVHAWACWQVYRMGKEEGRPDRVFLSQVFQNLLINYTWWVNRKEVGNSRIFSGGFLGLDNVSVFDRSQPLPPGCALEQADATAWMALFSVSMFAMALELAQEDAAYEDTACKFFDHFVTIRDAMNSRGGTGLWDEEDGFYYDQLARGAAEHRIRIRSIVGLLPIMAADVFNDGDVEHLPGLADKLKVLLSKRQDEALRSSYLELIDGSDRGRRLLALPSRERLARLLRYMLDETELLSAYGIRSVSKIYEGRPYHFELDGSHYQLAYVPGESDTGLFGGNSNWRGPVWFPINYLLISALERYHQFYGDTLRVECPVGSGQMMNLGEVATEINQRLVRLFIPDARGVRPCHGSERRNADDPHWRDYILFYEYFHGDTGFGLGAAHQTGWTALVCLCVESVARIRQQGQVTVLVETEATDPAVSVPEGTSLTA